MHQSKVAAAFLLTLFAPVAQALGQTGVASPSVTAPAELRREIEAANQAMVAAFNRGDLFGVARYYADDARIMGPRGELVQGRANIDRYWTGIKNPKSWALEVFEVGGSRDDAWQLGRSTLVSGAPGQEGTYVTDFIVLWRRQADGRLRIYIDMYPGGLN